MHEWIYETFGLITPYLSKFPQFNKDFVTSGSLSHAANSMNNLLNYYHDGNAKTLDYRINQFSVETMKKIRDFTIGVKSKREYELQHGYGKYPEDKDQLISHIKTVIKSETYVGNIYPQRSPVFNLMTGILFDGNWNLLSPEDLNKWASGWGFFEYMTEQHLESVDSQDVALWIMQMQDIVFLEIIICGQTKKYKNLELIGKNKKYENIYFPEAFLNFHRELSFVLDYQHPYDKYPLDN